MPSPRTVCFLGLYRQEMGLLTEAEIRSGIVPRRVNIDPWPCDELWTINDFYSRTNVKRPDRVFNPHDDITKHSTDSSRFPGDPIGEYNNCGAEIVTSRHFPELKRNRVFDPSAWIDTRRDGFFGSSFSNMFLMAWQEKWERINLRGIRLCRGGEYEHQVESMLCAIHESEKRGIQVDAPYRGEWETGPHVVSWQNITPVHRPYPYNNCSVARLNAIISSALIGLDYESDPPPLFTTFDKVEMCCE